MAHMAEGVAHVSFQGGGIFLPVRSPYDQQTLIEHIVGRVRSRGCVQVLIGRARWLVDWYDGAVAPCAGCGGPLTAACAAKASQRQTLWCVWCAFGEGQRSALELRTASRQWEEEVAVGASR